MPNFRYFALQTYKTKHWLIILLLAFNLAACGTDERLANFDQVAWKNDPRGCKGDRVALQKQIEDAQEALIGMDDKELRSILGKPDLVDLFKRNQKFYIYFLEPGKQCEGQDGKKNGRSFEVRFDALNFVSEISLRYPAEE